MKIQTVIFDVGNVLAAFRWKDYLQAFGFSPVFQEGLGRILFLDPLWFEWDRGVMTEDEIVEIFCGKHPDYRAEIFLDDSPANCQGAEAFGIRTILVQDRAAARRELRKLLA